MSEFHKVEDCIIQWDKDTLDDMIEDELWWDRPEALNYMSPIQIFYIFKKRLQKEAQK